MTAQETIQRHIDNCVLNGKPDPGAPTMLTRLVDFYGWVTVAKGCMIRDVHANLIPLGFREVQLRVLAAMMDQAAAGEPVRLIIGKSRKTGISTLIQAILAFLCAVYGLQRVKTVTHTAPASIEIFAIAVRIAKSWLDRPPTEGIGGKRELFWNDIGSQYSCSSAGGVAIGAGGDPNAVHTSEMPKWERNKEETWYNLIASVHDINLESIIVHEATFKGRDLFWRQFDDARKGKTTYKAIFIGWWMDPTLWAGPGDHFRRTATERNIARLAAEDGIEITDGALAWRRSKIAEIGEALFRQEYPSTPEEAIQATKGLILPMMRKASFTELPFIPGELTHADRIGSGDFGYADPTALYTGYRWDSRLWIVQEWWGIETLADQQVGGLVSGHTYYCDPAALSMRKELQRAAKLAGIGCRLLAAPRKKGPGEEITVVEMRNLIQAVESGRLMIHEDIIEDLLLETDTLSWDERTGRPDMKPTPEAHHFDRIMALVYLVMGALRPKAAVSKDKRPALPVPSRRKSFRG